jgi:hypothetical protein
LVVNGGISKKGNGSGLAIEMICQAPRSSPYSAQHVHNLVSTSQRIGKKMREIGYIGGAMLLMGTLLPFI